MREHVGPYRILEVLGRGGMGVVYRGVHDALDRQVAVKALAPELTQDPQFRERFFSEARTQAHLQHPNIITIYDLLEDEGDFFIVMELVEGEGLDRMLERGKLPEDEALRIFTQILAALDSAHSQGVIHRDVKSSNVLVTADGRVKLMDFGIALLVGDKRLTQSSQTIGTPVYMSPEQILRPREVDHRTDIYSAGILLYEMLTGSAPFDAETEYEIKKQHIEMPFREIAAATSGLESAVAAVLDRALAKDPEERFPSAGEFLRALEGDRAAATATHGTPPLATPPSPPKATRIGRRPTATSRHRLPNLPRRYLPWAAGAAVVALMTLGGLLFALAGEPAPESSEELRKPERIALRVTVPPMGAEASHADVVNLPAAVEPPPVDEEATAQSGSRPPRPAPVRTPPPPRPRPTPAPEPPPPAPAPLPDLEESAPPPPPPAEAEPDARPPADADDVIREAGRIARNLPDAVARFEEVFDDRLDNLEDTNRSILGTADYELQDTLDPLAEVADDLKKAYNAVASREGLDRKKGPVRWLRGQFGSADRDTFWRRAETTVTLGRRASEYADAAGSMDPPTRALWNRIQGDLEHLARLAGQSGGR